jgi:hypothetical protein
MPRTSSVGFAVSNAGAVHVGQVGELCRGECCDRAMP